MPTRPPSGTLGGYNPEKNLSRRGKFRKAQETAPYVLLSGLSVIALMIGSGLPCLLT